MAPGLSPLEQGVIEGENPVLDRQGALYERLSTSRVVWECSSKWVVNSI